MMTTRSGVTETPMYLRTYTVEFAVKRGRVYENPPRLISRSHADRIAAQAPLR